MDDKSLDILQEISKEILNIEASALKLKELAEQVNLPIAYFDSNRILATINVLKQTVSEPISFILLKDADSGPS